MRIYISGKITGLPFQEVEERFQQAEWLLEDLSIEAVNPLKNGLTKEHSWNQHLVRDIELLLECDGILMLDDWSESTGSSIEYDIALNTKKDIWFESGIENIHDSIMKIQNTILEVTGIKFTDYTTKSRKRECFFARMIFVYHCNQIKPKMTLKKMSKYIRRDHSSIIYYLKKYDDEIKYNSYFKEMAIKVEEKLNHQNTQNGKA